MIYLGEQTEARDNFYNKVNCWINIKLLGKHSSGNPNGYKCPYNKCKVCERNFKKLRDIDSNFVNFILPKLKSIITSKPDQLIKLEENYTREWIENDQNRTCDFKKYCSEIFNIQGYNRWFIKDSINYNLAEWLNQDTCTYCNRQYIFVVRKKNGMKGINCQFDHWFDKSTHPMLSLSFYNLIPSCSLCNTSVKSTKSFCINTHLHPYIDHDISEKFTFSYKKKSIISNEITFADEANLDDKTKRTLEDLGTKLVYKGHSSKELQDLIDLRCKYSDNYLDILLNKTFDGIKMSAEEKYRVIFGIELNEKNFHKRSFSKFKKDIITELLKSP